MSIKRLLFLLCLGAIAAPAQIQQANPGAQAFNFIGTLAAVRGQPCRVGQFAFASDQTAGQQLYACTTDSPQSGGPGTWTLQAGGGGGSSPGGSTNQLQTNAGGGLFGGAADFTFITHTLASGASGIVDLSLASALAGMKLPLAAGAQPTVDGQIAVNSTTHGLVWGSNGNTAVGALAGTGTSGGTDCSGASKVVTAISATIAPTCTALTSAYMPASAGQVAQYTSVAFSATPTFTVGSNTVSAWAMTLTGNVTSSTLGTPTTGQHLAFKLCQDGTGGRTFAWPTGFTNAAAVSPIALACTKQEFYWDGTNAVPLSNATVDLGPTVIGEQAASGTAPITGTGYIHDDSTSHILRFEDPSGNFYQMEKELSAGVRVSGGANAPDTIVTGSASNCVHVDGTSATCGAGASTIKLPVYAPICSQQVNGGSSVAATWQIGSAAGSFLGVQSDIITGTVGNVCAVYWASNTTSNAVYQFVWDTSVTAIDLRLVWTTFTGGPTTGNVRWTAQVDCLASGSDYTGSYTQGTATNSATVAVPGVVRQTVNTTISTITLPSCATGNLALLTIARDTSVGSNAAGTVGILSATPVFTKNLP
jgi:hypothetical protein